jgi:hypothetical protein
LSYTIKIAYLSDDFTHFPFFWRECIIEKYTFSALIAFDFVCTVNMAGLDGDEEFDGSVI